MPRSKGREQDRPQPRPEEVLASVSYFAGVDPATLTTVARAMVRRKYARNEVVFQEGEPSQGLYVVEDGWLKAVKLSPEGREQVLYFLGPGETFNALAAFSESANPATVIALEPSLVWIVRREVLLDLLDANPRVARAVIQGLAQRVQHLIRLVEDLSLRPVEARLARLLLEQAETGVMRRPRWATQTELAARLGTVPDVLSRVMRKLAAEGVIRVSRQEITILDPAALRARAGMDV